ncbi:MAG TPA: chemotaxis response regulator protein-glutamate methylesterase [archaeon]|nr:chemotaxis response regulator protein-glutamate methylesterase [archaeon]
MRIAIVNDMMIAVEILRQVIKVVPEYKVAWIARDGAEAVKKCAEDLPDIILMNITMPVMDGVETTRRIMKESPCPILIVTATVEGSRSKVFDAMGYGALDVVATPSMSTNGEIQGAGALLAKIATIGKLIGKPNQQLSSVKKRAALVTIPVPPLVIIGSSTGGPKALADILSRLPGTFGAALAIVQHVDVAFTSGLVEWLKSQTPLTVSIAPEGARLEPGKALVAATNDHLIMKPDLTLAYTAEPRDYNYRPSVDIFFKSVGKNWPEKSVAVLLTGMGSDGAEGLKLLHDAGWHTIAQDQSTSVVYGMPKAAVLLGAASEILPIDKVAPALVSFLNKRVKT